MGLAGARGLLGPASVTQVSVFFIFIFFENIFYRNIFSISQFTVLYPCRPSGGRQGACRPAGGRQGLICNLKKIICAEALGGSLPPPCQAAGPLLPHQLAAGGLPPDRGAAGSLLKYKTPPLPFAPSFSAHEIPRGEGERRGEGGNSNGEALPDFGSEPQVINISQLSQSKFFVCLIL